jgi:hypothetical protein
MRTVAATVKTLVAYAYYKSGSSQERVSSHRRASSCLRQQQGLILWTRALRDPETETEFFYQSRIPTEVRSEFFRDRDPDCCSIWHFFCGCKGTRDIGLNIFFRILSIFMFPLTYLSLASSFKTGQAAISAAPVEDKKCLR